VRYSTRRFSMVRSFVDFKLLHAKLLFAEVGPLSWCRGARGVSNRSNAR
jgi:hypothetical protein